MQMRKKLLSMLVLLTAVAPGAWSQDYTITLPSVEHGSVAAEVNNSSVTSAAAGATVSLVATPDAGYQLKSISGVYETSASKTETLNATAATVNGTKFKAVATARNNYGWRVYNPGSANTLTISSKDGATLIEKIELTSTWGNSRKNNMLSVSAGTLSFDGSDPSTTVTINNINATSVTISGSGTNAGTTWCISSATIYYEAVVETAVEISDTENANVKTFTMPSNNVTVSAEFELIPALTLDETTDNTTALSTANGKVCDVTLTRTLQKGGWNTFCAPFSTATPSGWTVKELTGSEFNSTTGELTLTFGNASSIEAGKPYLVKVGNNVVNPVFEGVTISNTTATTETSAVDFVPVMNPTSLTGGDKTVLFITGGNKLTYPENDGNINGFRAYFKLKDEAASLARAFRMSFDDDATGIVTVLSDEPTTASGTYTLDGRRIEGQPTQKGVYIVNGKKTIIK